MVWLSGWEEMDGPGVTVIAAVLEAEEQPELLGELVTKQ
jgi:hypothetical protein